MVYFIAGLKKLDSDWVSGYSMSELSKHWVFAPFTWVLPLEICTFFVLVIDVHHSLMVQCKTVFQHHLLIFGLYPLFLSLLTKMWGIKWISMCISNWPHVMTFWFETTSMPAVAIVTDSIKSLWTLTYTDGSHQSTVKYRYSTLSTHWGWVANICVSRINIYTAYMDYMDLVACCLTKDVKFNHSLQIMVCHVAGAKALSEPIAPGTNFSEIFSEIYTFSFRKMSSESQCF